MLSCCWIMLVMTFKYTVMSYDCYGLNWSWTHFPLSCSYWFGGVVCSRWVNITTLANMTIVLQIVCNTGCMGNTAFLFLYMTGSLGTFTFFMYTSAMTRKKVGLWSACLKIVHIRTCWSPVLWFMVLLHLAALIPMQCLRCHLLQGLTKLLIRQDVFRIWVDYQLESTVSLRKPGSMLKALSWWWSVGRFF